jgi:hypothetical protein
MFLSMRAYGIVSACLEMNNSVRIAELRWYLFF